MLFAMGECIALRFATSEFRGETGVRRVQSERIVRALIRPSGTFSRWEKEKQI